jgi:EAL domain-containing protein (putative c-di-GMP-specific phosphodiesterase class I)/CheY-like chemotaxis protein
MLKELRRNSPTLVWRPEATSIVPDQDAATRTSPLCYVVDDEQGIRHMISYALQTDGIATREFESAAALLDAVAECAPDLIFLDLSLDGSDAVDAIRGLDLLGYGGTVQLISGRDEALLNDIKDIGQRRSLRMLPVLPKPFRLDAIRQVVKDLEVAGRSSAPQSLRQHADQAALLDVDPGAQGAPGPSISLAEALANDWVEFWYQPIVDLRGNCLAAAELLARVRHPKCGILSPSAFLPGADVATLCALTERAIIHGLRDWQAFAEIGIRLKLAINVPVTALTTLAIPALVREHRPPDPKWPGLILEVTEDEIIRDIALANEVATQLRLYDVSLSIDDFGAGYSSLSRLREMPFCELKLDRSFVTNCAHDEMKAGLCQTIVDLAHHFGKVAVAEGIENAADLQALYRMGCDLGQGYLIARPMPKDQFLTLLQNRAEKQRREQAEAQPADRSLAV